MHLLRDLDPVGEDVAECAGAEHVPQRGGRQRLRGPRVVVHVGHRADGVLANQRRRWGHVTSGGPITAHLNLVVHDRIHEHRHAVLRQDLT